jgi:Spy/CpxP family protein refolding chaperone
MLTNRPEGKSMKRHLGALLLAVVAVAASPAWAEGNAADVTDMQALRSAVRTDKKAFVASVMKLTDAEAKKFWPAYDAYQRTFDMTNREKNVTLEGVIAQDKPLSDPYAKQIAKDLIAADEIEVKARRTLYNRLLKALPAKKALRYLQLEGKIRAVQAYDIAQVMPLVK